jgi:hypothetical protein
MKNNKQRICPKISEEDKKIIQRMLDETDWDEFWSDVSKKCVPEIDAYKLARAKSLEKDGFKTFI